jgi:hypothetical protein
VSGERDLDRHVAESQDIYKVNLMKNQTKNT